MSVGSSSAAEECDFKEDFTLGHKLMSHSNVLNTHCDSYSSQYYPCTENTIKSLKIEYKAKILNLNH